MAGCDETVLAEDVLADEAAVNVRAPKASAAAAAITGRRGMCISLVLPYSNSTKDIIESAASPRVSIRDDEPPIRYSTV